MASDCGRSRADAAKGWEVSKRISLQMWAARRYEDPPSARTLRRWVAAGNIFPLPKKEGRAYWVSPEARYIDTESPDYLEDVAAALHESSSQ